MAGERLGRFELVSHLASGGMAKVFLARVAGMAGFERHVVVKALRAADIPDESYIGMFLDEARLAASLHHQHVAQVYEVGCTDDTYFLAMEYIHGKTVRSVLEAVEARRLEIPLEFSLSVMAASASGLHHAHERCDSAGSPLQIVHRDVSPSNVLVSYDGSTKLIDFGIAKANDRVTHTKTGFIKGKAGYMAPEQARGYDVDRRSDVFSLGILLYELCTQRRAFDALSEFERVEKIVNGDIVPPSQWVPDFPHELEQVILTALALDPDDRFQTADEMRHAIEAAARSENLNLGTPPVARFLRMLFGQPQEPWVTRVARGSGPHDSIDDHVPDPIDLSSDVTRPHERDLELEISDLASFEAPASTVEMRKQAPDPSAASTVELRARAGTIKPTMPPPLPRISTQSRVVLATAEMRAVDALAAGDLISDDMLEPPASAVVFPVNVEESASVTVAQPIPEVEDLDPYVAQPMKARSLLPVAPVTVMPRRRRGATLRKQVAYVVSGGLVLGLVVGLAVTLARPTAAPASVPLPPVVTVPVKPAVPPVVLAEPVLATPTSVTPIVSQVKLVVTSEPSGATVVLDGERLGKTPFETTIPREAKQSWLKVRMQNFNATKIKVSRDTDIRWTIKLNPSDD